MSIADIDPATLPKHFYSTMIRERHLDTFGHVNNAQYMVLLEEARWEMITSRGYGLKDVHETGIGTVVLECTLRFMSELKLRETVTIETGLLAYSRKILTLQHVIRKESGDISAEAQFKMGCFDLNSRKLIIPTEKWLKAVTGATQGSG